MVAVGAARLDAPLLQAAFVYPLVAAFAKTWAEESAAASVAYAALQLGLCRRGPVLFGLLLLMKLRLVPMHRRHPFARWPVPAQTRPTNILFVGRCLLMIPLQLRSWSSLAGTLSVKGKPGRRAKWQTSRRHRRRRCLARELPLPVPCPGLPYSWLCSIVAAPPARPQARPAPLTFAVGRPFKPAAPPQLPVAQPSQFPELPPAPAVDSAAGTATPAPPPRVWLSGTRGNMPVVPPVPTAFYGAGQAPSTARPDLGATSIANGQPSGAQEFDRRWVALEDEQGAAHARTPVQQSEAEMGEMRMQVLMNENMALRSALRMDQKMPVEALKKQTSSNGTPEALRETRDVITPQNEMNRLQKELDQTASKLSKAESNVDRKAEMIQILRAQLDEADKKLSQGRPDNEERMRMQEDLMQSRAQIRALQQDLDKERKLKEDAWERLLKVDPEKLESLQAQLEEEKLNCAEMLEEIRGLRAEKDAAAREAAILISSLTAERNALMDEVQQARSGRDMQLNSLQDERGDAIEKLQSLREDYANLDSQVSQSKIDNQALMAQLKFLTQQLQAKQVLPDTGDQIASISNNQTQLATKGFSWPTLTPGEQVNGDGFRDADEQARFYEQQVISNHRHFLRPSALTARMLYAFPARLPDW